MTQHAVARYAPLFVVSLLAASPRASPQQPDSCYRVETITTPPGHAPEVSALAFARDGGLVVALRLGTMWTLDPKTREWRLFASGLHWPLGILPGAEGEFFVAQIPELTRVADTDGDGVADVYETICDAWGLSGNYHEFLAGPLRDRDGNFWVALGCASSSGALREPLRGPLTDRPRRGEVYGHHAPVPWRGWIVRISPGGELTPVASGLRQPNGLCQNLDGELFAVDNQGDWVGTSPLHHVTWGAFHGHPASLVWDRRMTRHPQDIPVDELRAMRKPAAVLFPQNDLAGSIAAPLCDTTDGRFGPYSGQLFVADWSHPRIHRVALERIDGVWQGACFSFLEGGELRRGGNRLAFAPDGSLWIAQVSRLWGGTGEGLQRVVFTGTTPIDILAMKLAPDGFVLEMTRPVDPASSARTDAYSLQRYRYLYHATYGSPKVDVETVPIDAADVSADGRSVHLRVRTIEAGFVYDLRPRGVRSAGGAPMPTRLAAYTVHRVIE